MNEHAYTPTNPKEFDSNCKLCDGKQRDAIHGVTVPKATVLNTPEQIGNYRSMVIASALSLYARTGMKPNRAYTPTRMLQIASGITGKKYNRGEYQKAADDIRSMVTATVDSE